MSGEPKVAVVTGAAGGIGGHTAALLREIGWTVIGIDLRPSAAHRSYLLDVTDDARLTAAVQDILAIYGTVTLLVTAAGYDEEVAVADVTRKQWDTMQHVILGGTVNAIRAVYPEMKRRQRGCIVAISSELAMTGCELYCHYAAAKGAVDGLIRSLALEAIEHGVLVNAVAPGPTDTPLLSPGSRWRHPDYVQNLPLQCLVSARDVAGAVAFLAEEGTYIVGQVISPNAGAVI